MNVNEKAMATAGLPNAAVGVRQVLAVSLGNGLEFYDFGVYALFAVYIGHAFFPARSGSLSLLLSLATFGVGFVTRPLGALILGRLGDRAGRRRAMLLCFLLMGIGTLMLAVTPSFARIGLAAPALAVLSRLVQGFAVGGDVGPTTAYMIEAAPVGRRGLYGSMQVTTQRVATLAAGLVGLGLSNVLPTTALETWGWRVALSIGVMIVPFGLVLRSHLPETLPPRTPDVGDDTEPSRPDMTVMISAVLLLAGGTISVYSLTYLTTYALTTLHMSARHAFSISVVASLGQIVGYLLSGWLSDTLGRLPMIRSGFALPALLALPTFMLIGSHPPAQVLYGAVGLLAICSGIHGPTIVALAEALPVAVRSGGTALIYAIAIAIFGGTTQFVVTWLIHRTGSALAPAWYWTAALLVALAASLYFPETAPRTLRGDAESASRRSLVQPLG